MPVSYTSMPWWTLSRGLTSGRRPPPQPSCHCQVVPVTLKWASPCSPPWSSTQKNLRLMPSGSVRGTRNLTTLVPVLARAWTPGALARPAPGHPGPAFRPRPGPLTVTVTVGPLVPACPRRCWRQAPSRPRAPTLPLPQTSRLTRGRGILGSPWARTPCPPAPTSRRHWQGRPGAARPLPCRPCTPAGACLLGVGGQTPPHPGWSAPSSSLTWRGCLWSSNGPGQQAPARCLPSG